MMDDRRLPYYVPAVDPESPLYNNSDSDGEHGPERKIDFTSRGNVLSSLSVLSWVAVVEGMHPDFGMLDDDFLDVLHMPVFDVDVPITDEVRAAVNGTFFGGTVRWVPSTNHHHCYVDGLYLVHDDYMERLASLSDLGIVQQGYVFASAQRHASFVRKPGVKKLAADE